MFTDFTQNYHKKEKEIKDGVETGITLPQFPMKTTCNLTQSQCHGAEDNCSRRHNIRARLSWQCR